METPEAGATNSVLKSQRKLSRDKLSATTLKEGKKTFFHVKKGKQKCPSIPSLVSHSLSLCNLAAATPASEMIVLTTF